ncbi:hypothetical protein HHI36_000842 [Cryptolaemus montrouzieri]|uniref:Uncharacterized protein n=1 Tax=Cryptolaemus montrouzieri TaxID=559131 RepID=A0ABD2P5Y0_9CUCU
MKTLTKEINTSYGKKETREWFNGFLLLHNMPWQKSHLILALPEHKKLFKEKRFDINPATESAATQQLKSILKEVFQKFFQCLTVGIRKMLFLTKEVD